MISYRELIQAFRELGLERQQPIIAHASLSSFGEIRGGAEALLGALTSNVDGLMMPTFTYKTMIIPEAGPEGNGLAYGSGGDLNRMAEFFTPFLPADSMMGTLAETLRRHPNSVRSNHPILSFSAIGLAEAVHQQTLSAPLAPIQYLAEHEGNVLLLGVDHTVNTSIHYAEKLAGRKQFTRWALTDDGALECPGFPGCSDGFEKAAPALQSITRQVTIGSATIRLIPLAPMIDVITGLIYDDPLALLCDRPNCERCDAVRASLEMNPNA